MHMLICLCVLGICWFHSQGWHQSPADTRKMLSFKPFWNNSWHKISKKRCVWGGGVCPQDSVSWNFPCRCLSLKVSHTPEGFRPRTDDGRVKASSTFQQTHFSGTLSLVVGEEEEEGRNPLETAKTINSLFYSGIHFILTPVNKVMFKRLGRWVQTSAKNK